MKKAVCLLLSLLTIFCFCSAAFAEESTIPLYVDIPAENIVVTVSTDGLTSASGAQVTGTITNNGFGTIYVTSATVQAVPSWELVNFSNGNMPFGTKTFGALINGVDAKDGDITATFGPVSEGTIANYTYQAKAARQPVKTNEQVANLVLVFGWVNSSSSQPVSTHQIGEVVQKNSVDWKVIDISGNSVTLLCMDPNEYVENSTDEFQGIDVLGYSSPFTDGNCILLEDNQFKSCSNQLSELNNSDLIWWINGTCVHNGMAIGPTAGAYYVPIITAPISSVWTE